MGETTFKQIGGKNFANDKVVISDGRIKHHYKYDSLRRNDSQMGNSSKSARAIRDSLGTLVNHCKDGKLVGRLNAEMMKVLQRDESVGAAMRGMIARAENMGLLQGFDFNSKTSLRSTFNIAFTTDVNRETGEVKITIASFKPASAVKAPKLATSFKIMAEVADINFDPGVEFNSKLNRTKAYFSEPMLLDNTPTQPLTISFAVKTGNANTIFIALGVDFHDSSNPLYHDINASRRVSAGCIIRVDEGVAVPYTGVVVGV